MSKKVSFFYLIGLFILSVFFVSFTCVLLTTELWRTISSHRSFNIPFIFAIILVVVSFFTINLVIK